MNKQIYKHDQLEKDSRAWSMYRKYGKITGTIDTFIQDQLKWKWAWSDGWKWQFGGNLVELTYWVDDVMKEIGSYWGWKAQDREKWNDLEAACIFQVRILCSVGQIKSINVIVT